MFNDIRKKQISHKVESMIYIYCFFGFLADVGKNGNFYSGMKVLSCR